jgi:outer membrane biosynthesis protein TonB
VPRASAREPAPPPPPAIWGGRGLVIGLGLVSIALIAAAIVLAVRGSAGDTSAAIDETATRLVENSAVTDRGELVSPPPSSAHTVPAAPVQPAPAPPAPPPAVAVSARPPTPPPPARPAARRIEKPPSPAAASHVVVPAPPASPESSPPEPAVVGSAPRPSNNVWVGRYSCAQGATALRLAINATTDTTVTATFTFGPLPENPGVRRGSFRMVGQARASGASVEYDLRPTAWIDRPDGYVMVGVSATKNGASLHGTIRAAGCGALDATLAGSD